MTRHEVEKEMMQYRTIFPIVRLLDAGKVCGNAPVGEHCPCHEFWHKDAPCQNCISRQVMEDHTQRTKLEYMGRDLYQVTAVYREVDGAPCVLELIQPLDCDNLIDPENSDRLMSSVSGYHIKLYHDALTSCYNRRYYEDVIKTGASRPAWPCWTLTISSCTTTPTAIRPAMQPCAPPWRSCAAASAKATT